MFSFKNDPRIISLSKSDLSENLSFFLRGNNLEYPGLLPYTELQAVLDEGYAVLTHNHDSRYYTESEVDALLSGLSGNIIGEGKLWFGNTAPDKWLLLNGDTIGSAASPATHAHDGLEELFVFLWNNIIDSYCPVSGGRGDSATADFAANKTLAIPDSRGRVPVGAGKGTGLSERILGSFYGEERHTTSILEMPAHTHDLESQYPFVAGGSAPYLPYSNTYSPYSQWPSLGAGGGGSHNNMQPSITAYYIIYTGVLI
jgi:microcystin-dependent protein